MREKQGRSSFSGEKEAKRLLSVLAGLWKRAPNQTDESFLVLFFKKEHLAA